MSHVQPEFILGCNVVSRCTTVCIRWEHPMFQSNCVVHSIKHYYITSLLICHMFTELRSHSRLHCSEQKHTYVHSRLAFTHLNCIVLCRPFCNHISTVPDNSWMPLKEWSSMESTRNHLSLSSNSMNLTMQRLALQWTTVARCALPGNSPFHVLFKGMQCWRYVLHLTVLCEQLLPSFIHTTECWCSLIQENNISLYCIQVIRRRLAWSTN